MKDCQSTVGRPTEERHLLLGLLRPTHSGHHAPSSPDLRDLLTFWPALCRDPVPLTVTDGAL